MDQSTEECFNKTCQNPSIHTERNFHNKCFQKEKKKQPERQGASWSVQDLRQPHGRTASRDQEQEDIVVTKYCRFWCGEIFFSGQHLPILKSRKTLRVMKSNLREPIHLRLHKRTYRKTKLQQC
ncbi:hypothetical protein CEXT_672931 [Caerostris extrusa]|uniref:Uncharacterized protein n=1 Tax=Caerostris extrusa TaxID=172846 RepID=A0AAV4T3D3_CAEEX|nr:hypothetical protein CEXT_672931 [Caerostris extrusa]